MGMYTTVIVDLEGATQVELQIKTGGDNCDVYRVGDHVAWWVAPHIAEKGGLLDGIYAGCNVHSEKWEEWWVCIKDHRIVEAVKWAEIDPIKQSDDGTCHLIQREELRKKHGIPTQPPRELWTESAWAQRAESDELFAEQLQRFAAETKRDPNDPGLGWSMYMRQQMRMPSFYQMIMPPVDVASQHSRSDGLVLRSGDEYMHFGRKVVLDRVYTGDMCSVCYPLGTIRVIPCGELEPCATAEELTAEQAATVYDVWTEYQREHDLVTPLPPLSTLCIWRVPVANRGYLACRNQLVSLRPNLLRTWESSQDTRQLHTLEKSFDGAGPVIRSIPQMISTHPAIEPGWMYGIYRRDAEPVSKAEQISRIVHDEMAKLPTPARDRLKIDISHELAKVQRLLVLLCKQFNIDQAAIDQAYEKYKAQVPEGETVHPKLVLDAEPTPPITDEMTYKVLEDGLSLQAIPQQTMADKVVAGLDRA